MRIATVLLMLCALTTSGCAQEHVGAAELPPEYLSSGIEGSVGSNSLDSSCPKNAEGTPICPNSAEEALLFEACLVVGFVPCTQEDIGEFIEHLMSTSPIQYLAWCLTVGPSDDNQMLIALYDENPGAFDDGLGIEEVSTLRLPDLMLLRAAQAYEDPRCAINFE